jgi:hypothetical protein
MKRKLLLAGLVGTLGLAMLGCSSGDDEEASVGVSEAPARDAAGEEGGDVAVAVDAAASAASLPAVGPHVVQTASLSLSVPAGRFEPTVQRARTIAAGAGGFVVASSASQGDGRRLVQGTLVVRIPERAYARVMEALSSLGRVEAREESGQDVSQELVDLQARIRHLEAVEARLLGFLERAETVAAALAVQSELNRVQLDLEQARGRLVYLDDQVAFATVALDVTERRAEVAGGGGGGPWGIVDAWRAAATGFLTVVGWIFVAAATIAPVALLLVLAFLAARRGLPRVRRRQA